MQLMVLTRTAPICLFALFLTASVWPVAEKKEYRGMSKLQAAYIDIETFVPLCTACLEVLAN